MRAFLNGFEAIDLTDEHFVCLAFVLAFFAPGDPCVGWPTKQYPFCILPRSQLLQIWHAQSSAGVVSHDRIKGATFEGRRLKWKFCRDLSVVALCTVCSVDGVWTSSDVPRFDMLLC